MAGGPVIKPARQTPLILSGTGALYSCMYLPELTQIMMLCPSGQGYAMYGMPQISSGRSSGRQADVSPELAASQAAEPMTEATLYAAIAVASSLAVAENATIAMDRARNISMATPTSRTYSVVVATP
jgi:hypothetical protein